MKFARAIWMPDYSKYDYRTILRKRVGHLKHIRIFLKRVHTQLGWRRKYKAQVFRKLVHLQI